MSPNYFETARVNFIKFQHKVKLDKKVTHKVWDSLPKVKVTGVKGQFKGSLGAFVTYYLFLSGHNENSVVLLKLMKQLCKITFKRHCVLVKC